jgi:tRNA nucleotidyltransferase (CCA-adding enzyme)
MSDTDALLRLIPEDVIGLCARLREHGKRGWVVGGCVRDLLRGKPPSDWDVATDARPEEVKKIFRKVVDTGIAHGTVTVVVNRPHYEVTTLRGEGAYSDGRRPDAVHFVDDIVADLARRDFTINAIAIDPVGGQVIDPFEGQRDLASHTIRAVGDARERFAEDGLRVLRAARFAATLECAVEPGTLAAMADPRSLDTYRKVSAERIRDEWYKAMKANKPSRAFELMLSTGLLAITCPEMMDSVGCEQNRYHQYDVWGHAMACLDACEPEPVLRVAALFHDIGKPRTRKMGDKTNDWTFYDHERVGAEMTEPILQRLKLSNEERDRVVRLVRHHLVCYSDGWSDAAVRRWVRRVGKDLTQDLYRLSRADALGKGREVTDEIASLSRLEERAEALLAAGAVLSTRDLAINGRDLMTELALAPGPILGKILERLLELVTDEPEANERGRLLEAARVIVAESSSQP